MGVEGAAHADHDHITHPFTEHGRLRSRHLEGIRRCHDSRRGGRQRSELVDQQHQQDEETDQQHATLHNVRPRDGAEAAERPVNQHDEREPDHTVVVGLIPKGAGEPLHGSAQRH